MMNKCLLRHFVPRTSLSVVRLASFRFGSCVWVESIFQLSCVMSRAVPWLFASEHLVPSWVNLNCCFKLMNQFNVGGYSCVNALSNACTGPIWHDVICGWIVMIWDWNIWWLSTPSVKVAIVSLICMLYSCIQTEIGTFCHGM